MAGAGLEAKLEEIAERATSSSTTTAAAQAMADALESAISAKIGGLTMSRFAGGPVRLEPSGAEGRAELGVSGATWTLADAGRRRVTGARARRGSGLRTPWGPRASVKGSTSAGFGIGASAGPDVMRAGVEAVRAKVNA